MGMDELVDGNGIAGPNAFAVNGVAAAVSTAEIDDVNLHTVRSAMGCILPWILSRCWIPPGIKCERRCFLCLAPLWRLWCTLLGIDFWCVFDYFHWFTEGSLAFDYLSWRHLI